MNEGEGGVFGTAKRMMGVIGVRKRRITCNLQPKLELVIIRTYPCLFEIIVITIAARMRIERDKSLTTTPILERRPRMR